MAYRPRPGRVVSSHPDRRVPLGTHAARLAAIRAHGRRRREGKGGALLVVGLVAFIVLATVSSAGLIASGMLAVSIKKLEKGLPDVRAFQDLTFSQPTRIYDRTGAVELARFWDQRREVVRFEDIPTLVLDATTAVEDRTFWDNPGFDLAASLTALASDVAGSGDRGGASTITQQLVRARLLPAAVLEGDLYTRKAKELIQAFRLTQAYPGEEGKKAIITAYLNEINYGAGAHGIAAAAEVYFGKRLDELSVSEAALLAGIPQRPADWDPYKFAVRQRVGRGRDGEPTTRLVVSTAPGRYDRRGRWVTCAEKTSRTCAPPPPIVRRDFVLRRLADGRGRWTSLSEEGWQAALDEVMVLRPPQRIRFKAPHFVWALQSELGRILADREPITRGGYRVITTLDLRAQRLGERYVKAGAELPNMSDRGFDRSIRRLRLRNDRDWITRLRGANIRNGAMAAIDYRTGDVLAYVGSAGYDRARTRRFDPRFDHAGQGYRQPGSAWKPIVYATAIDAGKLTAGSVILDITTPFGPGWVPQDADRAERGPILVREALQYSLNIPAIRALDRVGVKAVRKVANLAGFSFINGPRHLDEAGLAGAIGTVEVRLLDMVAAYGAFGNGGRVTRPRYILRVEDADGSVIHEAGEPLTTQVWSPQAAYIMADILAGNSDPRENVIWGPRFQLTNGPRGARKRFAAVKTGTTNDLRDYSTYGLLPIPDDEREPALAVGVWFGNSDHSSARLTSPPIYSMDNAGAAWHAFVRDYTNGKPVARFRRPPGIVRAAIDRFSGGKPGPWTRGRIKELFIQGTQPGGSRRVDPPGLLYGCGGQVVLPLRAENPGAPTSWLAAVNGWAARGVGSVGPYGTYKAYMYEKSGFGGPTAAGTVCAAPAPITTPSPPEAVGSAASLGQGDGARARSAPTCRPGAPLRPRGCADEER